MSQINADHINKVATPAFISQIQADCLTAMSIASREGMQFENPLLAAYHYQKHGEEFVSVLKNQKIEVYLTKVPDTLIQDGCLASVENVVNAEGASFIKKTYITPTDDFAVVIEDLDKQTISTMFNNRGAYEEHLANFSTTPQWSTDLVAMISQQFSMIFGFRGKFRIFVNFDAPEERYELFQGD